MKGRRLADNFSDRKNFKWSQVKPGDYFKQRGSRWYVMSPNGEHGALDSTRWTVAEHEDRTITVSPSIFFNTPHGWHGFLERGVWGQI